MAPISLALVWHQHQPYYPDDVGGENPMPWVRLHATKDYFGMALHLEEVPEFRCTINLVPSLLAQLEAYVTRGHRRAPDALAPPGRRPRPRRRLRLLDNFFMAIPDTMIRPHPRYHELYLLRSSWNSSAQQALGRFRPRDLRDLQVWSNLTWIHPLVVREGPRAGGVPRQGATLHRGGEALAPGQAAGAARAGHPAAPRTGRTRPGRADDDAVLSPHPAVALGQDPGARGDAGRLAAVLSRRLSRGRRRARPPRRRAATPSASASRRAGCGPARARSARR